LKTIREERAEGKGKPRACVAKFSRPEKLLFPTPAFKVSFNGDDVMLWLIAYDDATGIGK
jgi:hypothetical protein